MSDVLTQAKVRNLVRGVVGRPIPQHMWDEVVESGMVDEQVDYEIEPEQLEPIVEVVLRRARYYGWDPPEARPRYGDRRPTSKDDTVEMIQEDAALRQYEARRASAYGELVAWAGTQMPSVQRVREQILGGCLLPLPDAIAWLQSPAVALFPRRALESRGIPLVGHTATLVEQSPDEDGPPPILVQPGDVILKAVRRASSAYMTLEYAEEDGSVGVTSYVRFSVVDEIARAARALESALPWTQVQAVGFLLCGMVPVIQPLKVGYRHSLGPIEHATITIRVEPWVSAQTVEASYRRVQKELLGRENRPLMGTGLDVLRFCLPYFEPAGGNQSWEHLRVEWNRTNPDRPYTDRRNFARDFERAKNQLGRPGYRAERHRRRSRPIDSQGDSQTNGNNASNAE
jgi:hypothetical protein